MYKVHKVLSGTTGEVASVGSGFCPAFILQGNAAEYVLEGNNGLTFGIKVPTTTEDTLYEISIVRVLTNPGKVTILT